MRRNFRGFLVVALVICSVFAAWSWFRPYEWGADPAARCKVVGTRVTQDQSYYWLHVHLKMIGGQEHDLMKPVRLVTAGGSVLEPAETTLAGDDEKRTTDLWFKFWLESAEIAGPLKLQINGGELSVRKNPGAPALGSSGSEDFLTNRW